MHIPAIFKTGVDTTRACLRVRTYLLDPGFLGSPWQSVVVVLEAVSARNIVVEILSVAVEYPLGLKHFWLAGQDCEHVSTISPRHKVEMHFAKNRPHAFNATPDVVSHLCLRRFCAGFCPISPRALNSCFDSRHLRSRSLTMHFESLVGE
jgi:hypothetical protein